MRNSTLNNSRLYGVSKGPKYDIISEWIGSGKSILDVGCGTGAFSERLSNNGNYLTGVEQGEPNYNIAKDRIRALFGNFIEIEINETFDVVVFADVLEHMLHPEKALRKAKELADEVILCVPNFDFWGVRLLRLFGVQKMKTGILDESHVFFFNRQIAEMMIETCGFEVVDFSSPAPKKIPGLYNQLIELDYDFFGYQFIFRCKAI